MFCRAQILAKKVSARAFKVVPGKTGEAAGEIGIEGTTIEAPTEASTISAHGLGSCVSTVYSPLAKLAQHSTALCKGTVTYWRLRETTLQPCKLMLTHHSNSIHMCLLVVNVSDHL